MEFNSYELIPKSPSFAPLCTWGIRRDHAPHGVRQRLLHLLEFLGGGLGVLRPLARVLELGKTRGSQIDIPIERGVFAYVALLHVQH
jgi:hypothetical protein